MLDVNAAPFFTVWEWKFPLEDLLASAHATIYAYSRSSGSGFTASIGVTGGVMLVDSFRSIQGLPPLVSDHLMEYTTTNAGNPTLARIDVSRSQRCMHPCLGLLLLPQAANCQPLRSLPCSSLLLAISGAFGSSLMLPFRSPAWFKSC